MKQYTQGKKLIGKGAFTKCYDNNDNTVTLISNCPFKELLSHNWLPNSSRLPKCKRLDYSVDRKGNSVYIMPKYEKVTAPKTQLSSSDYKLYKGLKALADTFQIKAVNLKNPYNRLDTFRDCVKESHLHYSYKNLLIECAEGLANFTTKTGFEVSPRNLAINKGKLILLDLFYSVEQLNNVRSNKF